MTAVNPLDPWAADTPPDPVAPPAPPLGPPIADPEPLPPAPASGQTWDDVLTPTENEEDPDRGRNP